jgi:hypothetical protein
MKPTPEPKKEALPDALRELVGQPVQAIDTPALVVDLDAMQRNLSAYGRLCEEAQHTLAPARQDAQERGHRAAADAGWRHRRVRAEDRRSRSHGGPAA